MTTGGGRRSSSGSAAVLVASGALVLLVLALALREEVSPDTFFHLAAGRWIAEHGAVPRANVFLAFHRDHPFLDHEWLFQLLAHFIHRVAGPAGLALAKSSVVLAAFAMIGAACGREGRAPALAAVLAAVLVSSDRFLARPEVASIALLALFALVLERERRAPTRALWALPFAAAIWANAHGFAILGPALILIHLIAAGALALAGPRAPRAGLEPGGASPRRLAIALALSIAAMLATPYGLEGLLYPLRIAALAAADPARAGLRFQVIELTPTLDPSLAGQPSVIAFRATCVFTAAAIAASLVRRRARLESVLAALALAALGGLYVRNLPFAAIGLALPLARGIQDLRVLAAPRAPWLAGERASAGAALVGAAALSLAAAAFAGRFHENAQYETRAGLGFSSFLRYDDAVAFLDRSPPRGALFNNFGAGHFLIWARAEKEPRPFICGNTDLYPREFLEEYHDLVSGRADLESAVARYAITDALLDHRVEVRRDLIEELARDARWRLVHLDARCAIFRRAAGDATPPFDLDRAARDPEAAFRPADTLERLHVAGVLDLLGRADAALALARRALDERPGYVPALHVLASLERRAGRADDALAHAEELVRRVPGWAPARIAAGQALLAKGDSRAAATRFDEALAIDPEDPVAGTNLLAALLDASEKDAGLLVELRRALARPSLAKAVPAEIRDLYAARASDREGDLDRAESSLRAALAARPSFREARLWLGIILFKRGSRLPEDSEARVPVLAEARASFEALLAGSSSDGEAWLNLGSVRYYQKAPDDAIDAWLRARDLRPRDAKPCLFLARAYLDVGKRALAIDAAKEALAREPKNIGARALLEEAQRAER